MMLKQNIFLYNGNILIIIYYIIFVNTQRLEQILDILLNFILCNCSPALYLFRENLPVISKSSSLKYFL